GVRGGGGGGGGGQEGGVRCGGGRGSRHRHDLGAGGRRARQLARDLGRRTAAGRTPIRRDAPFPRRRRYGHHAGTLPARRLRNHRAGRLPRNDYTRHLTPPAVMPPRFPSETPPPRSPFSAGLSPGRNKSETPSF